MALKFFPRTLALFLTLALSLPAPSFALRSQEIKDNSKATTGLEEALRAGAEEETKGERVTREEARRQLAQAQRKTREATTPIATEDVLTEEAIQGAQARARTYRAGAEETWLPAHDNYEDAVRAVSVLEAAYAHIKEGHPLYGKIRFEEPNYGGHFGPPETPVYRIRMKFGEREVTVLTVNAASIAGASGAYLDSEIIRGISRDGNKVLLQFEGKAYAIDRQSKMEEQSASGAEEEILKPVERELAQRAIRAFFDEIRIPISVPTVRSIRHHLATMDSHLRQAIRYGVYENTQVSYQSAMDNMKDAIAAQTMSYAQAIHLYRAVGAYIDAAQAAINRSHIPQKWVVPLQNAGDRVAADYNKRLYHLQPDFYLADFSPSGQGKYVVIGLLDEQKNFYRVTHELGRFEEIGNPSHVLAFPPTLDGLAAGIGPAWQMVLLPTGVSPAQASWDQVKAVRRGDLGEAEIIVGQKDPVTGVTKTWTRGTPEYEQTLGKVRAHELQSAFPGADRAVLEKVPEVLQSLGWRPDQKQSWLFLEPTTPGLAHVLALAGK